jgi:acetyl esterase/lipase
VQGVLEHGWSAALPGYTLAHKSNTKPFQLAGIVEQLRAALDWFQHNAPKYGICGPVILSGWSAGGHLTAVLLNHPIVTAGLAISGLFELGPLLEAKHINGLRTKRSTTCLLCACTHHSAAASRFLLLTAQKSCPHSLTTAESSTKSAPVPSSQGA